MRGTRGASSAGPASAVAVALALALSACGGGDEAEGGTGAADGEQVFNSACSDCHSVTGETKTGPPLDGIYGTEVQLADGSTVTVDEEYLEQSIREPKSQLVDGFGPVMPDMDLSDDQVEALVTYVRSLSE